MHTILTLLPLFLPLLPFSTATPLPLPIPTFEEHFLNTLPPTNSSLTLVGYKSIPIAPDHVAAFEADYFANVSLWGANRVYDRARRAVRVYFPVAGALVSEGEGERYLEADEWGVVRNQDGQDGDAYEREWRVLGRKQTDKVTGVEGNIIKDGIIFLSTPACPVRRVGNALIYDFGAKHLHSHPHPHQRKRADDDDGKKSCLQNHNGINCSKAYGIRNGRCPMNPRTCMDYNGIITDCKNYSSGWKKYRNFVGSDCDVSLGRGHCWNEVM